MKSNREIALEVIDGKWGTGDERIVRLTNAGYNSSEVQKIVNQIARDLQEYEKANLLVEKSVLEVDVDLSKYGALILNFKGV